MRSCPPFSSNKRRENSCRNCSFGNTTASRSLNQLKRGRSVRCSTGSRWKGTGRFRVWCPSRVACGRPMEKRAELIHVDAVFRVEFPIKPSLWSSLRIRDEPLGMYPLRRSSEAVLITNAILNNLDSNSVGLSSRHRTETEWDHRDGSSLLLRLGIQYNPLHDGNAFYEIALAAGIRAVEDGGSQEGRERFHVGRECIAVPQMDTCARGHAERLALS